jgi:hypothetical protein
MYCIIDLHFLLSQLFRASVQNFERQSNVRGYYFPYVAVGSHLDFELPYIGLNCEEPMFYLFPYSGT